MPITEFATISDVKDYMPDIDPDVTRYDNKLQMLLDAGNMKCGSYTGETEADARLKVSVCKYVEFNFSRKTGVDQERDDDFQMKYTAGNAEGKYSDVPAEVLDIWDEYLDGDDENPNTMKVTFI